MMLPVLRPRIVIWISLGLLLAFTWSASAQLSTCPALVEQALVALQDNCGELDRNSACYGFNQIDTTFTAPVDPGFFTEPADRTVLTNIQTLRTSPLNLEQERWGVAVMNVQANLPGTLPGQAVTFVLVGDAEVQNDVAADSAFIPGDPVDINLIVPTQARSGPGENTNSVAEVAAGTVLQADATSGDGGWLRVVVDERPAWIDRTAVAGNDALDGLPAYSGNARSPMQAFYFTTGIGQAQCREAPNALTIRSPENIAVDLNVNGLDVRIGSTITLESPGQGQLNFTVQQGQLRTVTGEIVNEGQTLPTMTDEEGNIITIDDVRESTEDEMQTGQMMFSMQNTVHPLSEETNGPLTNEAGEVIHIVQPGETLFSIARLYNASMPAIVARNGLADPTTIFVGQQLIIPNAGSGFVGLPLTITETEEPGGLLTGVDCAPFRATSPLDGLALGANTFYWDAAPGADGYRVTVFNATSGQSTSFETLGTQTNLTGNVDQVTVGTGFSFAWQVQALLDGQVVCTSTRITTQRAAQPTLVPPVLPFAASWACGGPGLVVFSWANLPAGQNIIFDYTKYLTPNVILGPFTAPSGSVNDTIATWMDVSNGFAITSGGASIALTPSLLACP
jgi:LysM repeat protein